jgi:hypothetical protein
MATISVILITVAGPAGHVDIGVRSDVTPAQLAVSLGDVLGTSPPWAGAEHRAPPRPGDPRGRRAPLRLDRPLGDAGVADGDLVIFGHAAPEPRPAPDMRPVADPRPAGVAQHRAGPDAAIASGTGQAPAERTFGAREERPGWAEGQRADWARQPDEADRGIDDSPGHASGDSLGQERGPY